MSDQILLALDYGGTKLAAAMAGVGERTWRALERSVSPPIKDARYEYAAMLAMARKLLGDQKPAAIGVSFGGPVDAPNGRVILSHNVEGWEEMPLRDRLQADLGAPASVDNDANVAALGEYAFGAGQGVASLLYVTVSTGVGGGWVIDGKIFSGADGMAGEIGHTICEPQGALCVCGRHGCVEAMACGTAIARDARERLHAESNRGAALRSLVNDDISKVTGALVAQAANLGDELAIQIMDQAAHALGFGIGTAITLLNPELVVVGGGVSKSGERYWRELRASARANTLPHMRVEIVPAKLGDDAPLWGAVALAEKLSGDQVELI